MSKATYIVGAGGHATVVVDLLKVLELPLDGFLALDKDNLSVSCEAPLIGDEEALSAEQSGQVELVNGIGAKGSAELRTRLYLKLAARGFDFATLVHPAANLGFEAQVGRSSLILARACLQAGARLGENCLLNTGAIVEHGSRVGDHSFISPGAVLCGDVRVGESCFIGAGAVLLPDVQLGDRVVVGAGTIVNRNVDDGCTVVGNPARLLRKS